MQTHGIFGFWLMISIVEIPEYLPKEHLIETLQHPWLVPFHIQQSFILCEQHVSVGNSGEPAALYCTSNNSFESVKIMNGFRFGQGIYLGASCEPILPKHIKSLWERSGLLPSAAHVLLNSLSSIAYIGFPCPHKQCRHGNILFLPELIFKLM